MGKLLFVDIDGVLITRQSIRRFKSARVFDPDCVKNFNHLIKYSNAEVVVSSTWRIKRDVRQLTELFRRFNAMGTIIDKTPHLSYDRGQQGLEIRRWLDATNFDGNFVIIDDEVSDMGELLPYVVQTNMDGGLQYHHVQEILQRFGI